MAHINLLGNAAINARREENTRRFIEAQIAIQRAKKAAERAKKERVQNV